jgi:hypothetical protein
MFNQLRRLIFLCAIVLATSAHGANVTLAGLAYSGDSKSIAARFPYTKRLEAAQAAAGNPFNKLINQAVAQNKPANFELNTTALKELKGQDQVVVVALMITGETVSAERFGNVAKLLTQVRAQAMFFDFKSMTVLRAYPFSFTHLDVIDRMPTQEEMNKRFEAVYFGEQGKAGIFDRFTAAINQATIPTSVPRYVQVSKVNIGQEALDVMPANLKSTSEVAQTWAADLFGERLSNKTKVSLLPYSKGYAIGNVMSMRIADGDVYMLKLPEPDYTITLDVPRFKKIKSGEAAAGTSYIYGAFANVKIQEPTSGKSYMDADFKNGEVKLVPASQDTLDDFPAYHDALKGLFEKLSENLAGNKTDWLKSINASPELLKQISSTQDLLKSCK